eukprot:scaffold9415_cov18-Prasinocladus_malaysianus.AAC.1
MSASVAPGELLAKLPSGQVDLALQGILKAATLQGVVDVTLDSHFSVTMWVMSESKVLVILCREQIKCQGNLKGADNAPDKPANNLEDRWRTSMK